MSDSNTFLAKTSGRKSKISLDINREFFLQHLHWKNREILTIIHGLKKKTKGPPKLQDFKYEFFNPS